MINNKTFLAIIPARGGSKRLPRKNILNLGEKPLIAWSIEAGLKSRYIDKVIVTSDDDEILTISEKYGANILKRPIELASDTATSFDAIEHVLKNCTYFDYIVLLQPTSPLRDYNHIDEAIDLLNQKKADAIVSVCETEHNPLWSNTLPENNDMCDFIKIEIKNKRSQELEQYYRLNGAIYVCKTERLLEEKTFLLKNKTYAYKMSKDVSVDIDEKIDFCLCQCIIDEQGKQNV